jgi:uncharacterized protein with PIN domain
MTYIDTSCLLKLVNMEPETVAVIRAVSVESTVVISALADLEALIQLKALHKAGHFSLPQWRKSETELYLLRNKEPYQYKAAPAGMWEVALRQHRNSGEIHCRALDRLHLAAMEKLGLTRLLTHDATQATAARALGFEVVQPGR